MLKIDLEKGLVAIQSEDAERTIPIGSPEAFELISKAWVRSGWDGKYVYSFSWMGRPIIQLPDDVMRIQEAIYAVKPDVVVETGVAHGGSLILYASLFRAMGRGRVIGVDIEIRPHNRAAIEAHEMSDLISLVEGSSTAPEIVSQVRGMIRPGERVMVILDSNHSRDHVRGELEAYGPLVSEGSYIVATDGIMGDLVSAPRSQPDWGWNNPRVAAEEFLTAHPEFEDAPPAFPFNEGTLNHRVTYWPGAWLRRK
jgi:cephalosporin hydroxylase